MSTSAMPAVNSAGKTMTSTSEAPRAASRRGDAEQADLGRGVEAEPEQEAEREHVPGLCHQAEHRAEQARQESAAREQRVELRGDVDALRARDAKVRHRPTKMARLMAAITSRNSADTDVPMRPPISLSRLSPPRLTTPSASSMVATTTTVEWPSAKKRPTLRPAAARMHQLAHDIVDGGDVVGIDGMAEAKHPGQQRGRHHRRPVAERREGPGPCGDVGGNEPAEQQHGGGLDRP